VRRPAGLAEPAVSALAVTVRHHRTVMNDRHRQAISSRVGHAQLEWPTLPHRCEWSALGGHPTHVHSARVPSRACSTAICTACNRRDALLGIGTSASVVTLLQTQLSSAHAAIARLLSDAPNPPQVAALVECDDGGAAPHDDKPRSSPESSAYSTATDASLCGAHSAEVAAPDEQLTPGNRRSQPLPSARCRR